MIILLMITTSSDPRLRLRGRRHARRGADLPFKLEINTQ